MKTIYYLLFYIASALLFGCDDNSNDVDYENAILGKWLLVEQGYDKSSMKSIDNGATVEFLSDGKMIRYFPESGTRQDNYIYIIDDELLYWIDSLNPDINNWSYSYEFHDNKLRISYVSGLINLSMGTPHIHIYKRIN